MGRKNRSQRNQARYREQEEETEGFEVLQGPCTPVWWDKMDEHQAKYCSAIEHYRMTLVDDPAGTSKTTIAVAMGLQLLKAGKVDYIHYVRFPDKRALSLGFEPGSTGAHGEKERGYMHPFYEAMAECGLQPEFVAKMIDAHLIECSTDIHMRGRTLGKVFLIVDEAQNGDIKALKLILTRIKDNGKSVVIGHTGQTDNNLPKYGVHGFIPFEVYQLHMVKKHWATRCRLYTNYRGEVSQWADSVEITIQELEEEKQALQAIRGK